jgi:hypothetical protein
VNLHGAEEFAHSGDCPGCAECESERPCVGCGEFTNDACEWCKEPFCDDHVDDHIDRVHEGGEEEIPS